MHHITLWAKKLNNNIWLIQLQTVEPSMVTVKYKIASWDAIQRSQYWDGICPLINLV